MVQIVERSTVKGAEQHWQKFKRFEQPGAQPAWLLPLRKEGMAHFAERGYPTTNDEDWRFTNVAPIVKLPFEPVFDVQEESVTPEQVAGLTFGRLEAARLVFVNGHYAPSLSTPGPEGEGVRVGSLAAALAAGESAALQKHLGEQALGNDNAFTALNNAFFQDGALVQIPAGKVLPHPVHLVFISTARQTGAALHPRTLVLAGRDSQATIVESYSGATAGTYVTNAVTEVVLEEGAVVEHCKFQDESLEAYHIAALHARLGRNCNFISHSIATGARLSRNTIRTSLAGEGVECVLNGLYLTKGEQLADHHMVVEHAQPHGNSHEYYNGILDGRSKGVFHGRILVRQIAQKTDAKQTNKNLLLSDKATVDTKPQLEIYADDVKCTHGATVGQLNEDSIFYLRARGIGAATARRMLIHAFAGEIIERIQHPVVREELDALIWDRLESNPHLEQPG